MIKRIPNESILMQSLHLESRLLAEYRRHSPHSPRITMGKMSNDDFESGRQYSLCVGCGGEIHDQYILRVAPNLEWHAACLKCSECQMFLDENCTCFVRDGKTFCKKDYVRLFGAKCEKCCRPFGKNDFVMRAKSKIFHLECFRCVVCDKQLVPGDEFAFRSTDGSLFCKEDHTQDQQDRKDSIENNNNIVLQHNTSTNSSEDNSEAACDLSDEDMSVIDTDTDNMTSSSSGGSKKTGLTGAAKKAADRKAARARTVLSEKQLNILKTCYSANPRPDALMKEQLVEMTGLSPRVIRVWFQNKRCKDKKIQNRMMEKQLQQDGRKLGYGGLHGIPMVASSPVRHDSPLGMNPVEIQSYEPPWKTLSDFALHTDLDRLNPGVPHFQHLVNQMHGYPDMPPHPHGPPGHDPMHGPHLPPGPPPHLSDMPPYHPGDLPPGPPPGSELYPHPPPPPGMSYLDGCDRDLSPPLSLSNQLQAEATV